MNGQQGWLPPEQSHISSQFFQKCWDGSNNTIQNSNHIAQQQHSQQHNHHANGTNIGNINLQNLQQQLQLSLGHHHPAAQNHSQQSNQQNQNQQQQQQQNLQQLAFMMANANRANLTNSNNQSALNHQAAINIQNFFSQKQNNDHNTQNNNRHHSNLSKQHQNLLNLALQQQNNVNNNNRKNGKNGPIATNLTLEQQQNLRTQILHAAQQQAQQQALLNLVQSNGGLGSIIDRFGSVDVSNMQLLRVGGLKNVKCYNLIGENHSFFNPLFPANFLNANLQNNSTDLANSRSSSTPPVRPTSIQNKNQIQLSTETTEQNSNQKPKPTNQEPNLISQNPNVNQNSSTAQTTAQHSSQNSTISFENNVDTSITRRSSHNELDSTTTNQTNSTNNEMMTSSNTLINNFRNMSQDLGEDNQNSLSRKDHESNKIEHDSSNAASKTASMTKTKNANNEANSQNNETIPDSEISCFNFKKIPGRRIQNPASTIQYSNLEIHGANLINGTTIFSSGNSNFGNGSNKSISDNYSDSHSHSSNPNQLPPQTQLLESLLHNQQQEDAHLDLMNQVLSTNADNDSLVKTPWIGRYTQYSPGSEGLAEEIIDFVNYIKTTPEEIFMRRKIIQNIKNVVMHVFPNSELRVFGSFRTGLYLPTSDIDISIIGQFPKEKSESRLLLHKLRDAILDSEVKIVNPNEADSIKVLENAAIPIIKLRDWESSVSIDLSFNTDRGVQTVKLVHKYLQIYPCLKYLVFVLKQFLLQRDLNEVWTGGLSSYSLVLLVVSFLQNMDENTPPSLRDQKEINYENNDQESIRNYEESEESNHQSEQHQSEMKDNVYSHARNNHMNIPNEDAFKNSFMAANLLAKLNEMDPDNNGDFSTVLPEENFGSVDHQTEDLLDSVDLDNDEIDENELNQMYLKHLELDSSSLDSFSIDNNNNETSKEESASKEELSIQPPRKLTKKEKKAQQLAVQNSKRLEEDFQIKLESIIPEKYLRSLKEADEANLKSGKMKKSIVLEYADSKNHMKYSYNTNNLGILLTQFFELYGKIFNYNNMTISVRGRGSYIPKEQMSKQMAEAEIQNGGNHDSIHNNNGHNNDFNNGPVTATSGNGTNGLLSIEDPLLLSNDVGKGSYAAGQVRQAFEYAYRVIHRAIFQQNANQNSKLEFYHRSTLSRVLRITDEIIAYRSWIKRHYGAQMQNYLKPRLNSREAQMLSLSNAREKRKKEIVDRQVIIDYTQNILQTQQQGQNVQNLLQPIAQNNNSDKILHLKSTEPNKLEEDPELEEVTTGEENDSKSFTDEHQNLSSPVDISQNNNTNNLPDSLTSSQNLHNNTNNSQSQNQNIANLQLSTNSHNSTHHLSGSQNQPASHNINLNLNLIHNAATNQINQNQSTNQSINIGQQNSNPISNMQIPAQNQSNNGSNFITELQNQNSQNQNNLNQNQMMQHILSFLMSNSQLNFNNNNNNINNNNNSREQNSLSPRISPDDTRQQSSPIMHNSASTQFGSNNFTNSQNFFSVQNNNGNGMAQNNNMNYSNNNHNRNNNINSNGLVQMLYQLGNINRSGSYQNNNNQIFNGGHNGQNSRTANHNYMAPNPSSGPQINNNLHQQQQKILQQQQQSRINNQNGQNLNPALLNQMAQNGTRQFQNLQQNSRGAKNNAANNAAWLQAQMFQLHQQQQQQQQNKNMNQIIGNPNMFQQNNHGGQTFQHQSSNISESTDDDHYSNAAKNNNSSRWKTNKSSINRRSNNQVSYAMHAANNAQNSNSNFVIISENNNDPENVLTEHLSHGQINLEGNDLDNNRLYANNNNNNNFSAQGNHIMVTGQNQNYMPQNKNGQLENEDNVSSLGAEYHPSSKGEGSSMKLTSNDSDNDNQNVENTTSKTEMFDETSINVHNVHNIMGTAAQAGVLQIPVDTQNNEEDHDSRKSSSDCENLSGSVSHRNRKNRKNKKSSNTVSTGYHNLENNKNAIANNLKNQVKNFQTDNNLKNTNTTGEATASTAGSTKTNSIISHSRVHIPRGMNGNSFSTASNHSGVGKNSHLKHDSQTKIDLQSQNDQLEANENQKAERVVNHDSSSTTGSRKIITSLHRPIKKESTHRSEIQISKQNWASTPRSSPEPIEKKLSPSISKKKESMNERTANSKSTSNNKTAQSYDSPNANLTINPLMQTSNATYNLVSRKSSSQANDKKLLDQSNSNSTTRSQNTATSSTTTSKPSSSRRSNRMGNPALVSVRALKDIAPGAQSHSSTRGERVRSKETNDGTDLIHTESVTVGLGSESTTRRSRVGTNASGISERSQISSRMERNYRTNQEARDEEENRAKNTHNSVKKKKTGVVHNESPSKSSPTLSTLPSSARSKQTEYSEAMQQLHLNLDSYRNTNNEEETTTVTSLDTANSAKPAEDDNQSEQSHQQKESRTTPNNNNYDVSNYTADELREIGATSSYSSSMSHHGQNTYGGNRRSNNHNSRYNNNGGRSNNSNYSSKTSYKQSNSYKTNNSGNNNNKNYDNENENALNNNGSKRQHNAWSGSSRGIGRPISANNSHRDRSNASMSHNSKYHNDRDDNVSVSSGKTRNKNKRSRGRNSNHQGSR